LAYRRQDPIDFIDSYYSKEKYAICYSFSVSPINGMDMWPKPAEGVEENGIRKRIKGVAYKCTRCSQFGHNAKSCKSKTQDPDGLKRKVNKHGIPINYVFYFLCLLIIMNLNMFVNYVSVC
jgi:hypothetical protein